MNYNLRDLSLIILLVILITITCSINMNEYFYVAGCPIKKKNFEIVNSGNDSSKTISYVEKSDNLSHGKLFDFFERDQYGKLDYSLNKILVTPINGEINNKLIQNLKDCKNVCILFYSSKIQQFNLDFSKDTLGGDGESIKKHFGNFSNPNNPNRRQTVKHLLNRNVCTSDDKVITDTDKFKKFGDDLFIGKTNENIIDTFKKGVYNDELTGISPTIFKIVDCNLHNNKNFCFNNGIKKYPTLKFYKKIEYCTKDNLGEEINKKLRVRRRGLSEFREMGSYDSYSNDNFKQENIKNLLKKYLLYEVPSDDN